MLLYGCIESLPSPDSMTSAELQTLILKRGLKFVHQNFRGLLNSRLTSWNCHDGKGGGEALYMKVERQN